MQEYDLAISNTKNIIIDESTLYLTKANSDSILTTDMSTSSGTLTIDFDNLEPGNNWTIIPVNGMPMPEFQFIGQSSAGASVRVREVLSNPGTIVPIVVDITIPPGTTDLSPVLPSNSLYIRIVCVEPDIGFDVEIRIFLVISFIL